MNVAHRQALDDLDHSFLRFPRAYGYAPGAEWRHDADCIWYRTSIGFPVYRGVLQTRMAEDDQRVEELLASVRSSAPGVWFIGPRATPSDLSQRLEKAGLSKGVELTGMAASMSDLALAPSSDVDIRPADTEQTVRDYARIYPLLFGAEDNAFIDDVEAAEVEIWRSGGGGVHRYVAYKNGVPVCAGSTTIEGEVASLDTLCTLPEERNQGIGAALATLALRDEEARGATRAVIWAGPGAEKLYARMGFDRICTAPIYIIPGNQ
jgi:GNAT superfamily N-acetyltransferase